MTAVWSRPWPVRLVLLVTVAVCLVIILGPFTPESVGGAAIVLMLLMVFSRIPIAVALFLPALLGLWSLYGDRAALNLLTRMPYETVATWELSVIPMFVFMGLLLWRSGITEQLYRAAGPTVGRLPGGLAIGTNLVGIGLAAVSGATIGVVHALARIGIPEMLRAGYDKRLAVGSVIVAGLPGQIIPPSVFLLIYAGLAEVPVGPQLMAGVIPGIVLGLAFCTTVVALCLLKPGLDGRRRGEPADESVQPERMSAVAAALAVVPLVVLMVIVLGGMYVGIFTATEAGAAGALGALLLTLVKKGRTGGAVNSVVEASFATLKSVGSIFLLIIGAMSLSRLIAVSGIGSGFADWISGVGFNRVSFLIVLMIAYLIMGAFMDPLSIMLLTVPLLLPVIDPLGIDPLFFGVFVVLLAEMAIITPPVGVLAFIVSDIVKEADVRLGTTITLNDIFRGILWFMPAVVVVALLLIGAPALATWLPSHM